ncbi:glycoside hydrolase family 16 protein [Sphingobacterium chuzhouense]|uniref:Glycoside hydrolase family 16 protein n=2 Tax=Sphingobacterium chuzhouense TaxID=1742264 RepID=A0ABR7XNR6_9SPHI|nr:glycoside hydrolase family 16 protein [Sphingobacterium chuzhouense]MBD1420819.1 glycoside hydrolase family 16 protein [Sphingobacterium chuzhouense]
MKLILFAVVTVAAACSGIKPESGVGVTPSTPVGNNPMLNLIWYDDFNGEKIDEKKWSFAGRGNPDWKKYCTDSEEVTYVKDGCLYLKAIKNKTQDSDTAKYQTGCVFTYDNFSFRYGKVEVSVKMKGGKGAWPAIWMMPEASIYGGWPKSGEIDIMERLNNDGFVHQTLHSEYTYSLGITNPTNTATASIDVDAFNTYAVEWTPTLLMFSVNGKKTFVYPKVDGKGYQQWPFDQNFHLILNQAVGGAWVGAVDDADLPVEMLVDWVKVYQ